MRDGLNPPAVITPLQNLFEGSVLGRVVAGESSLELLININRVIAITRTLEDVRAQIAALRVVSTSEKCKHGMLNVCCAICKEQNGGGLVDARGTGKRYVIKKTKKKDVQYEVWSVEGVDELRKTFDFKLPEPRTNASRDRLQHETAAKNGFSHVNGVSVHHTQPLQGC